MEKDTDEEEWKIDDLIEEQWNEDTQKGHEKYNYFDPVEVYLKQLRANLEAP